MIKAVAASCEMAVIDGHNTADRFNCNKRPTYNSGICVSTSALNHPILSLFLVYSFTHSKELPFLCQFEETDRLCLTLNFRCQVTQNFVRSPYLASALTWQYGGSKYKHKIITMETDPHRAALMAC